MGQEQWKYVPGSIHYPAETPPPPGPRPPLVLGQQMQTVQALDQLPRLLERLTDMVKLSHEFDFQKDHPTGVKEGLLEKLIKQVGGRTSLIQQDLPFLEQYLHPEVDVLPKTDMRPTYGGADPTLVHRSLTPEMRKRVLDTAAQRQSGVVDFIPGVLEGLGAKNISSNDQYESVYDKWDFDTDAGLWDKEAPTMMDVLVKAVMKRIGTPYAVYDRFPLNTMMDGNVQKYEMGPPLPGSKNLLMKFNAKKPLKGAP